MKLFDKFTVKKRYFVVKEKNMIEVMNMVQSALSAGYSTGGMNVGKSELVEESNLWSIHINLTGNQWRALLESCKGGNYQLVIKDNPDKMYFTKIEGSK